MIDVAGTLSRRWNWAAAKAAASKAAGCPWGLAVCASCGTGKTS